MSLFRLPRTLRCLAALLVVACAPALDGSAAATEYLATDDFRRVEQVVAQYVEKYGGPQVLFAVDIDNTLLAMDDDLGSDQWFEWQDFLLANEPESPHLVADNFGSLLEIQGVLFALGTMHPPQTDQPAIVRRIQQLGVATLVLTSRGSEFRKSTVRELRRNGYDLARSVMPTNHVPAGNYSPYDLANPGAVGLTTDEVTRFELKEPRPVSFADGIMMTAGQHKGAMLLTMLHCSPRKFRGVVFVDDHGRHVGRVFAALSARGIDVTTIHYTHEDSRVAEFQYSDKSEVARHWQTVVDALEAVVR